MTTEKPAALSPTATGALVRCARIQNQSAKKVSQILNARGKLAIVHQELEKQFQVALTLWERIQGAYQEVKKISKELPINTGIIPYVEELDQIFKALQRKKLPPQLAGMQKGRTLFDFVDAASVENLHIQAQKDLDALKTGFNELGTRIEEVNKSMQGLFRLRREINLPDTTSELLEKQAASQKSVLKKLELETRRLSSSTDGKESLEVSTQSHKSMLESTMSSIMECQDSISASARMIEESAIRHGEAYERAIRFFTSLEKEVPWIQQAMHDIESYCNGFKEHAYNLFGMMRELRNLVVWYTKFQTAYKELTKEIQRRHVQMERQQAQIENFQAKLDLAFKEETKRRNEFSQNFARFLPSGLCPALHEPVTSCRVLPPRIVTDLPKNLDFGSEEKREENPTIDYKDDVAKSVPKKGSED